MAKTPDAKAWHRLIGKAEREPFFLGSALVAFSEARGLTDRTLAEWLVCSLEALDRLKLCRRPDDREAAFGEEIRRIAAFAPCDPLRLVELHREVAALAALAGESPADGSGFLLAARDRQPRKGDESDD